MSLGRGVGFSFRNCSPSAAKVSVGTQSCHGRRMPAPRSSCNPQVASDCWATMSYATSTGALNDTTTWAAEMLGNPARLIL